MTDYTLCVLEFENLLIRLSEYCSSPIGKEYCLKIRPSTDTHEIESNLNLLKEMRLLLKVQGNISFSGVDSIGELLDRVSVEGALLEAVELRRILDLIKAGIYAKRIIGDRRDIVPSLFKKIRDIPQLKDLSEKIEASVDEIGNIRDSASTRLRNIRQGLIRIKREMEEKIDRIKRELIRDTHEDIIVSLREGRFVLRVSTILKNRVKGIVHQYSPSSASLVVEPMGIVEINNRIAELRDLEREEEIRILRRLSYYVRDLRDELSQLEDRIGKLDVLLAKAKYSEDIRATNPIIDKEGILNIREAKNPILISIKGWDSVQGVDLKMDREKHLLIISGPNRGGKTVTLKTLGLLCLMAQSGLHIPASEGSRIPVYNRIMADIGDEQDMEKGLSTFSAHMQRWVEMMDGADRDSLIIIDEPGVGTDPEEGAALAMSVLDELLSKGCYVAISTHLNRLKLYGMENPKTQSASMEIDEHTHIPTYRLRYGMPGASFGFDMAREVGIGEEVIERAKGYLAPKEAEMKDIFESLRQKLRALEMERRQVELQKKRYEYLSREVKRRLEKLRDQEKQIISEKIGELSESVAEAKRQIAQIINRIKRDKRNIGKGRRQIEEIEEELINRWKDEIEERRSEDVPSFEIGQMVRYKPSGIIGKIVGIDRQRGTATFQRKNLKVNVSIEDLENVKLGEKVKGYDWKVNISVNAPLNEINIIGYRVEDAISLIDKVIGEVHVRGKERFRIIHGHGEGILKRAVREYLKGIQWIKRVGPDDIKNGGDAVTVVEFREL